MPRPTPIPDSRRSPNHQLVFVGHRGAAGIAPENTLASFQAALVAGVQMVELDVHLSRDGQLVVMHDSRVDRTTNGQGRVSDLTLAQLRELDAAAHFAGKTRYGVQRIPILDEVFDLVQGWARVNVEIKLAAKDRPYPGIERKLVQCLRRRQAIADTIIASFDVPTLQRLRAIEPRLDCLAIVSTAQFPYADPCAAAQSVARLVHSGLQGVAIDRRCLSEEVMLLLKRARLRVAVWVINDIAQMWQFESMGVDYLTTDRPDLLLPAYRQEEQRA